jgi:hypothetical protein
MTKTGQTGAIPQPLKYSYNPQRGYTTTREYKGTGNAALADKEAELRNGGWTFTVDREIETGADSVWRISAQRGGGDSPEGGGESSGTEQTILSDQWELASNMVEKDILESDSPLMLNLFTECASLPSNTWTPMKSQEDAFTWFVRELKDFQNNPTEFRLAFFSPSAYAYKLARLIIAGVKSERVFQPTLRHNKNVTSKYEVKDALTNCGSIITAASIDALEGIPSTILFNLPTDYDSGRGDALGTQLKYGWFKKYPNVTQQADGEWSISQEFEWGLWHTDLYTFV